MRLIVFRKKNYLPNCGIEVDFEISEFVMLEIFVLVIAFVDGEIPDGAWRELHAIEVGTEIHADLEAAVCAATALSCSRRCLDSM